VAAVMVIEGILPFANPSGWRKMMLIMIQQTDNSLRLMGLVSMMIGLVLLYAVFN